MNKPVVVAILLSTLTVQAESLEEKNYWKGQMNYVERELVEGEKRCGVKFTFEFVDKPKLRAESEKKGFSPNGICSAVVSQTNMICRQGDEAKASVKSKIKGFQCGIGKPRSLEVGADGIVRFLTNNDEPNVSEWLKKGLEKKL